MENAKTYNFWNHLYLKKLLAGDVSRRWNTLISHLMLISQKLEEQSMRMTN